MSSKQSQKEKHHALISINLDIICSKVLITHIATLIVELVTYQWKYHSLLNLATDIEQ